jgi:drug/metabolite transporter (DMT)-like permease
MLMMSLVPVIATLLAWLFLDETMGFGQIVGIVTTLGGIFWVVLERDQANRALNHDYARGVLYGLGGALGQATGLVLAKNGLSGEFSPLSGNLIRMTSALVVLWLFTFLRKEARFTLRTLMANRRGVGFIAAGAVAGPFLGVSLSLLAVQRAEVGVASTLMSLPPVFLLPISYFAFKERFGWGAVGGTLLALAGVAILFLV